jgi:hypothetical protein
MAIFGVKGDISVFGQPEYRSISLNTRNDHYAGIPTDVK